MMFVVETPRGASLQNKTASLPNHIIYIYRNLYFLKKQNPKTKINQNQRPELTDTTNGVASRLNTVVRVPSELTGDPRVLRRIAARSTRPEIESCIS